MRRINSMALFQTEKTTDELRQRIDELQSQLQEKRLEYQRLQNEHARAFATGADTSETSRKMTELAGDIEALPESIRLVESELERMQAQDQKKELEGFRKQVGTDVEKAKSAMDKAIRTMRKGLEQAREANGLIYGLWSRGAFIGLERLNRNGSSPSANVVAGILNAAQAGLRPGENGPLEKLDAARDELSEKMEQDRRLIEQDADSEISRLADEIGEAGEDSTKQ
jgi:hypothetical protein